MKVRAELNINGGERKVLLVSGQSEPDDHLAHRLAACILFWDAQPILDASVKTPALADYEFLPDLIGLNDAGEIVLWVECGSVTTNKLTKITRRLPRARLVIMKETERQASELRRDLDASFDRPEKVEILAWPDKSYKEWAKAVTAKSDKTEAFGEAGGHLINVVMNEAMFVVEFKSF
ncbi:MAG: YaeQ family protein [Elusimicrobia bacterium]|nr:YaeQ family protein [Elusimicrobiota bacterium]MDE2511070.1 YaeQ family protein [Elusimicrobiota bacterium]